MLVIRAAKTSDLDALITSVTPRFDSELAVLG